MSIRLFITGGTIDGFDCSDPGKPSIYSKTRIPELLANARLNDSISMHVVVFKDGRSLTDADRNKLLDACQKANESHLLITHGTSTMVQTALFLSKAKLNKTIVLFGAAKPLGDVNSDAPFNFGFALSSLSHLSKGVYVVMNGCVFTAESVKKNVVTGRFESA